MGAMRICRKSYISLLHLREFNHSSPLKTSWNPAVVSICQLFSYRRTVPSPRVFIKLAKNGESDNPYAISKEQESLLTRGSTDAKLKLQETLLLLYLKQSRGELLPEALSLEEFADLMHMSPSDVDEWLIIYSLRRGREKEKDSLKVLSAGKQGVKNELGEERVAAEHFPDVTSSLFLDLMKRSRSHFFNTMLGKGLLFGQQIVFDCSYEAYMNEFGIRETARSIHSCIKSNRKNRRPFSLHFCNVASDCRVMHFLKRRNPEFDYDLPVRVYNTSYLELFERERIVYLSPHSSKELEYHPDDVYVLGAISQENKEALALKKARFEGIRCARLPVGFPQWVRGSRILTTFEAFEILLMKKNTGNWSKVQNFRKRKTLFEVDEVM